MYGNFLKIRKSKRQQIIFYIVVTIDNLARIYGSVILHKPNNPLRPIVSMLGHPVYNLSNFLCKFLDTLIDKTYIVKNSLDFVSQLTEIKIGDYELQVSFDVDSLFTKIPIELAKTIIVDKITPTLDPFNDNQLTIEDFKTTLDLVCSSIVFIYEGQCYIRIDGFPVGLPPSGKIGDIVVNHI